MKIFRLYVAQTNVTITLPYFSDNARYVFKTRLPAAASIIVVASSNTKATKTFSNL